MKRFLFISIFTFSFPILILAEIPTLTVGLNEAEQAALKNSPRVQAAAFEYDSALSQSQSQMAPLFPRLSFDAGYRYVTEVPAFRPVPGGPAVPFGDNENYSYGPAINWTAWNSGGTYNRWKSSQAAARSKKYELDLAERQIILETRVDYFQVQLALEEELLLADSLKLAESQYKDISLQQKAGTLSRIDSLSTHQVVLNRRRDLRNAQTDVATALRNLFALTGLKTENDISLPVDIRISTQIPANSEIATILISLDPIDAASQMLSSAEKLELDLAHPRIEALSESAEAARRIASSLSSGHGPTIQVVGKITRDYPNGPILESINQKTIGIVASLPIFEFNRVVNEVKAEKAFAESLEKRKDEAAINLKKDWEKARDQLSGLFYQRKINLQAIEETKTLAKLVYDSYKYGQSNYLEVETADLRSLQSKVISARTEVQILIQLAIMDSLGVKQ